MGETINMLEKIKFSSPSGHVMFYLTIRLRARNSLQTWFLTCVFIFSFYLLQVITYTLMILYIIHFLEKFLPSEDINEEGAPSHEKSALPEGKPFA